ncbi:MAG: isocitrate lyase/PEP mutase family protein [Lachnospiraceae bacterium]|nr:isocitrate lyase/PEP mutase family protein [Lachnospiraceae bacterium]
MGKGSVLRQCMKGGMVTAPFVNEGYGARLAQQAGFKAIYLTGFGSAAAYGIPDVGLLTYKEMTEKLSTLAEACELPIIADADTGYGGHGNVYRTVRGYERAGAAALHLEDQVWPKRCGYMADKQVIDRKEAASKIKAAVDARMGEDLIIIARTDSLAVHGWDEVEERLYLFLEAGADMVFVDGIKTKEQLSEYGKRFSHLPAVINNVPLFTAQDIKEAGDFKIQLHAGPFTSQLLKYMEQMDELARTGNCTIDYDQAEGFERIVEVMGARFYLEMEKRYAGQKYV